ncbi:FAD-dependent oxidoreductase [Affinibrenneria salicis]|uniref:FAD-dependent oxidoreductase n=1 Tax=Affinibrenneria salicis TaxID=2590031 RepID=A0A5J5G365_9GAMM|nr:FAD/NAD(P)-binding oxidoreductase [Affinibrenneria salicis]KAA9001308.1 FAD-dependent oxidoreductase [Affinibrenneria salicis]
MTQFVDVAVIGAGPAGMSAATEAAMAGLSVTVLDEHPAPGGQIYRNVETAGNARHQLLGKDYSYGLSLTGAFRSSNVEYIPRAIVWNISTDKLVEYSQDGQSKRIRAGAIILATGAFERPCPLPGWTLPGVTTAGALQVLLKTAGVVQENVVLVGSGPLIWLVAAQMIDVGCPPLAVVENVPKGRMLAALPYLLKALKAREYLFKGIKLMQKVRRTGVPVYRQAKGIEIAGDREVQSVTFVAGGKHHRLSTKYVALHQGVVPNQQATRLLNCEHVWDRQQHCFRPVVDASFETSVAGIYAVGDSAGIAGAKAAELQGRIAALSLAEKRGHRAAALRDKLNKGLRRENSIRPFLEIYYAPAPEIISPADTTIVCRCEEISAATIRASARLGAKRPNEVKSLFRAGMGPCQGRVCGLAVQGIIAETMKQSPEEVGYYRIRAPLKPIPLSELGVYRPEPGEKEGRAV